MKTGDPCKTPGCRETMMRVGGAGPGGVYYRCYGCDRGALSDSREALEGDRAGAALSRANAAAIREKGGL